MLAKYFLITESCLIDSNGKPKEKAIDTITCLNHYSIPFCILSSNTKWKLNDLASYYKSLGFYNIQPGNFYTSSMAAVDYLISSSDCRYEVHLGGAGLVEALKIGGFITSYEKCEYVFIGSDHQATYDDYSELLNCLLHGAKLICLDHALYEQGYNKYLLGPGSITLMLEAASKKKAMHFSLPSRIIIDRAIKYLGAEEDEILVVGTDIENELLSGIKLEMNTAIISDGNSHENDIMTLSDKPIYYLSNISSILG